MIRNIRKRRLALATASTVLAAFAAVAQAHAQTTPQKWPSQDTRSITVTGAAWCTPRLGIAPGIKPEPCSSVTLNTSYGGGYRRTVTPISQGGIGELGKFTFTGVPAPAQADLTEVSYTLTANLNGSVLTQTRRCLVTESPRGVGILGNEYKIGFGLGPWGPLTPCDKP